MNIKTFLHNRGYSEDKEIRGKIRGRKYGERNMWTISIVKGGVKETSIRDFSDLARYLDIPKKGRFKRGSYWKYRNKFS